MIHLFLINVREKLNNFCVYGNLDLPRNFWNESVSVAHVQGVQV